MKKTYSITGKLIHSKSGKAIKGLRVEAWDKDMILDDFVGESISSENGGFHITFTTERFKELFSDNRPDLYFKIYLTDKLIHSTERNALWNVETDVKDIVIKVPI